MNLKSVVGAALLTALLACSHGESSNRATQAVSTLEYYAAGQADSLSAVVKQQVAAGKTPVLYFYADWCGPCRRFRETLPDEQVQAALASATLIKINIDEDAQELAGRYGVQAVPTFVKVDAQLAPLATISSDKWAEDVPANVAPVMHQLVATRTYDQTPATGGAQ